MGKLSALAAQIEGAQPISAADLPDDLARRHAATADAIRAAGVPDRLNRYLMASPVEIAAGKERIARGIKAGRERAVKNPPAPRSEPMKKMGPKQQALYDLRTQTNPPKATAPAITETPTAQPEAQAKETPVTSKTTKSKARTAVNGKTKASGKKTKSDMIADLLRRPEGCTTADVLKATGWAQVSIPPQARAAGLKLRKKKEGSITRYFAA